MTIIEEYARALESLSGNEFQAEVSAYLQTSILSFQPVPAKPLGDAGLDGFSHEGTHGYCCYGPEHDEFKTPDQRAKGIVKKFKGDLRKLFELEEAGKKLICKDMAEMETILPAGKKLMHMKLLVNWFESHRILGPIGTAVDRYKLASKCRYVDPSASVIVLGPKNLAQMYAVDANMVLRAKQREFIKKVQKKAETLSISDAGGFEEKIDTLHQLAPDNADAVNGIAKTFRTHWRMALAVELELHDNLPHLHRALEEDRQRILGTVSQLMLQPQPWQRLNEAVSAAEEILSRQFSSLYGPLIRDVSSGEIARLMGECPVGWKRRN